MIRVTDITFDTTPLPAVVQSMIAQIDAVLSPAWGVAEFERTFTVTWANYGGMTTAKIEALRRLTDLYQSAGFWSAYARSHNSTASVIVFNRTQ